MPQACVTKSTPPVYRKLPVTSPSTYTPPSYKRTPPPRIKAPLYQPRPEAFRFSHGRGERETRVTGDEPQETMGRVQLSPSRLPFRAHFHRGRDVWVRGSLCTLHRNKFNLFWRYKAYFNISKCKTYIDQHRRSMFRSAFLLPLA